MLGSVDASRRYRIALPEASLSYSQDAEWCVVDTGAGWQEIRFHDYAAIYAIDGLYERIFYDILRCDSPHYMGEFLARELHKAGVAPEQLRVLDLGAGNGIMGRELRDLGVDWVVGADILPEAARAADRDRPGIYRDYHVMDLSELTPSQHHRLTQCRFTALTCIAALGFGDIPPACFRTAFNLLEQRSWVALTIKNDFITADTDPSGFATLIRHAIDTKAFEVASTQQYQHRIATNGTPLHYTGIVGRKRANLPP